MTATGRHRLVAGLCGGALAAAGLSACGSSDALALARTACTHVHRSLTLYTASLHAASPADVAADQKAATAQLEAAQPDAATAAGEDATWQGLMTTISESPRVPEQYLVYALGQQCAVADSPGGDSYVGPSGPGPTAPPFGTGTAPTGTGSSTAPAGTASSTAPAGTGTGTAPTGTAPAGTGSGTGPTGSSGTPATG